MMPLGLVLDSDYTLTVGAQQKALGKPMWPAYYKLIEPNSVKFLSTLYEAGKNGNVPLETYPWLRQVSSDSGQLPCKTKGVC
jgi:hypothetical protein